MSIEVVPYSSLWPETFESESLLIQEALGKNCIAVHHIGSTSVPGLNAKPIIDILPVVKDILDVNNKIKSMEAIGYESKGENGIAFRRFFQKGQKPRTFNVHVFQEGDPEISRYIRFRDWMRSHKEDAEKYAKLKIELAAKHPNDILAYCNGKDAFVASIDAKDGYDGHRMVQALTEREWAAVRELRNKNFFKTISDPYTWTFNHKDHIHFVFYKNSDIIGYCHLQLWPGQRAALRIIAIDENHRKHGLGGQFLRSCERWLTHQGFNAIVTQASPAAYPFYIKNGYIKMPFNDPDGYEGDPQDIEIGKTLI